MYVVSSINELNSEVGTFLFGRSYKQHTTITMNTERKVGYFGIQHDLVCPRKNTRIAVTE